MDEHVGDRDELSEEERLAYEQPALYSALVDGDPWNWVENGIRHIVVKDMDLEQRYSYRDGVVIPVNENIF